MAYAGYRVALDDEPYTYASFCAWYGNAAAERIWQESPVSAVSYTHLTLPTKRIV